MNWRPIETAPKVWASLLLAKSTYDGHFIEPVIGGWDDGAWRNRNGDHLEGQVVNITHWMPLPPPPATEPAPQDMVEKWPLLYLDDSCGCFGDVRRQDVDEPYIQVQPVGPGGSKERNEQRQAIGRRVAECWNLLAGHDLSQVVVLDKAVFNEVGRVLADVAENGSGRFAIQAADTVASLNAGGPNND